jgi:hypothetical protein
MASANPSISAFNLWKIQPSLTISLDRNARYCANTRPPFKPLHASDFVAEEFFIMEYLIIESRRVRGGDKPLGRFSESTIFVDGLDRVSTDIVSTDVGRNDSW